MNVVQTTTEKGLLNAKLRKVLFSIIVLHNGLQSNGTYKIANVSKDSFSYLQFSIVVQFPVNSALEFCVTLELLLSCWHRATGRAWVCNQFTGQVKQQSPAVSCSCLAKELTDIFGACACCLVAYYSYPNNILFKSRSPLSLSSDSSCLEIFTHPSNQIKINRITYPLEDLLYQYFFYKSHYPKEYD